jgi:hypothetical protein
MNKSYLIISGNDASKVQNEISKLLSDGYQLHGNLKVIPVEEIELKTVHYFQAVIK